MRRAPSPVHRSAIAHVGDRALTIACDNMWGLHQTLEFGDLARELGYDLYMVRPAEWARGTPETLADFYRAVANAMRHAPAVRCYDAVYCPQSDRSHLLLDDMSATHSRPEFPLPPLNRHCDQLIDCVAQLHAFWWNHPRLGDDIGAFPDDEFVRNHYEKLEEARKGHE